MDFGTAQTGIVGLLGAIVAGLLGWRLHSKVKSDNARDRRESRYEDDRQRQYEAVLAKNSELRGQLEDVARRLAEAEKRLMVVQMISDGDPARAVELSQDSAFVDLSRPMRPRAAVRPSPSDPFQAADPYAPTSKRKKPSP